jgi:rubrerythrin
MPKTSEDLKEAFAGESMANRKYLAFAQKADEEGHHQAARLFRAAAHAETVHAFNHFKASGEVKSTAENIMAGIEGEHYEAMEMYPPFLEHAKAENNKEAARSYHYALQVEKQHEELYKEMLASLGKGEEDYDYYVCPVCGSTHKRSAPDKCPICGTPKEKFERIH